MKRRIWILGALLALAGCFGKNTEQVMENEKVDEEAVEGRQVATFGCGCFWCTEAVFELLNGVESVVSGYAGGAKPNPTYEEICTGETGHAEVVKITFNPTKVSYETLLETFGKCHDPTTLNRQGADVGTQYRSVIMYHDESQKAAAEKWKVEVAKEFVDPIVTEITATPAFFPAEESHQDFFRKNPYQGYCSFVIRPKLEKLKLDRIQKE